MSEPKIILKAGAITEIDNMNIYKSEKNQYTHLNIHRVKNLVLSPIVKIKRDEDGTFFYTQDVFIKTDKDDITITVYSETQEPIKSE
jgi:hypothetical protein